MSDWRDRLNAMVEPDQATWNLSPNDVAAIRAALADNDQLRGQVAALAGACQCTSVALGTYLASDEGREAPVALASLLRHIDATLARLDAAGPPDASEGDETVSAAGDLVDDLRASEGGEHD